MEKKILDHSAVGVEKETNTTLLFDNIRVNMSDGEFFIRKGIGWALREYSKTSAEEVIDFVTSNKADLSPLSQKEGLKVLIKQRLIGGVPD